LLAAGACCGSTHGTVAVLADSSHSLFFWQRAVIVTMIVTGHQLGVCPRMPGPAWTDYLHAWFDLV
jgi:hypothetical protein